MISSLRAVVICQKYFRIIVLSSYFFLHIDIHL